MSEQKDSYEQVTKTYHQFAIAGSFVSLVSELKRRNVLRVAAAYVVVSWLLIQVAETVFPLFGYGDTPARLVVIVLAIGFIPAIVLSRVFELTPEGLRKDIRVEESHTVERRETKRLDQIIIAALVLALGYFAFDKFVLDPARDAAIVSNLDVAELAGLGGNKSFTRIRDDAPWLPLLRSIGQAPKQLAEIRFNPTLRCDLQR